ncbi:MAG TPA: thiamine pyrophosphate-dependent enzyme [Spirochaetota bacterium]|nr:thiamine pyrophosphate-dependent enzyme [Spirochaetota bacterium]HOM37567.1 thiamine pyrophosphate-dependent enzyme [Spirochaetota bacterium]HPQ49462.1 thiamine pyrophosphate-dependent enzyme [Spirochaetota bacterium]
MYETKMNKGHLACAGCGATIAMGLASGKFPEKSVVVIPASCWSVIGGPLPYRTLNIPSVHTAFACAPAVATGIYYALAKKYKDHRVIVWAGDGSSFDIGLQSLSGALERGIPFTYICYDNEAYMNTGIQRSSATPLYTITTTTPENAFKKENKKNFLEIAIAHNIEYAATATIAFPDDLKKKVEKAVSTKGPSVIHIFSPCPTGQGFKEMESVKISRLAGISGFFPIYEYENEKYKINIEPDFSRLKEYITMQKRFASIDDESLKKIEKIVIQNFNRLKKKSLLSLNN